MLADHVEHHHGATAPISKAPHTCLVHRPARSSWPALYQEWNKKHRNWGYLSLLLSNHLIRLQVGSSTGICVPNGPQPGPAGGCRLKTEAPIGESHLGPKKSAQAAPGFTRQAVGIRLGRGSLYRRPRADQ